MSDCSASLLTAELSAEGRHHEPPATRLSAIAAAGQP